MDVTLDLILTVRNAYDRMELLMLAQLDQLPLLESPQVYSIVRDTVCRSLTVIDKSGVICPKPTADTVANNALSLVLKRQMQKIPSVNINNELAAFVRDETLQSLEHALSIVSVYGAVINIAMTIVQIIRELEANKHTIETKLRAVAIAAQANKPAYIDPADIAVLGLQIYRRAKIEREEADRISEEALEATVSLVRSLAVEECDHLGVVGQLPSDYVAERGFLWLRHCILNLVEDLKRRD